jgi:hypothetical protein
VVDDKEDAAYREGKARGRDEGRRYFAVELQSTISYLRDHNHSDSHILGVLGMKIEEEVE